MKENHEARAERRNLLRRKEEIRRHLGRHQGASDRIKMEEEDFEREKNGEKRW